VRGVEGLRSLKVEEFKVEVEVGVGVRK